MNELWKKVNTDDGREILFAMHRVKGIDSAYKKAAAVIRIAQENNLVDGLQVSLSQEDLTIVLHGNSKEQISQTDWDVAKQIESSLN